MKGGHSRAKTLGILKRTLPLGEGAFQSLLNIERKSILRSAPHLRRFGIKINVLIIGV